MELSKTQIGKLNRRKGARDIPHAGVLENSYPIELKSSDDMSEEEAEQNLFEIFEILLNEEFHETEACIGEKIKNRQAHKGRGKAALSTEASAFIDQCTS